MFHTSWGTSLRWWIMHMLWLSQLFRPVLAAVSLQYLSDTWGHWLQPVIVKSVEEKMNVSMYSSINAGSANWLGSYQDFEMWLSVIIPNLDAARSDTGSLHVATTLVDLKILLQDHKIQSLNFLKVLSSELLSMIGLILGLHAGGRQLHRRAESSLASLRDIMPAASTPRT